MQVIQTPLEGVLLFKPKVFGDHRGFFLETFRASSYGEHISYDFVQHNHSRSGKGILRGLHFQHPQGQGKLVRVARGRAFDVAVDIRPSSPNFGKWFGVYLDDESHSQLWIPPGFGHGFYTLSDVVDVLYHCTDYYAPQNENCIAWNDTDIGIEWPLDGPPVLSDKDRAAPRLAAWKEGLPQV